MPLLKFVFTLLIVMSLVVFLYGTVKLAKLDTENNSVTIETDIPGVEAQIDSQPIEKDTVRKILTISAITFILSLFFLVSTNKKDNK